MLMELYVPSKEAIALKSNIEWIDQVIDKEIRKDYADALTPPLKSKAIQIKPKLKGLITGHRVWFIALMDSLANMCKISKVSSEYSMGAHGIATFEDYILT